MIVVVVVPFLLLLLFLYTYYYCSSYCCCCCLFAVPNAPFLKRLCTVVIWKPPTQPSGTITSYELCFGRCSGQLLRESDSTCYTFAADDNFFVTSDEMREQDTEVQVGRKLHIIDSGY